MQRSKSIFKLAAVAAMALSASLAHAVQLNFDSSTIFSPSFNSFATTAVGDVRGEQGGLITKQYGEVEPLAITGDLETIAGNLGSTGTSAAFMETITNASNGAGLITPMNMIGFDIDFKFTFAAQGAGVGEIGTLVTSDVLGLGTHRHLTSLISTDPTTLMQMGSISFSEMLLAPGDAFSFVFTLNGISSDNALDFEITQSPVFAAIVVDTPEPATLALLGLGFAGLGAARRKKA